jgi:threonine dehydratase
VDQDEVLGLIRSVMAPTPLEPAVLAGREVMLKREDLGPNRAFKWRGALAAVEALRQEGAASVVTASTGNHGVAVAWAAARLSMTAHVVVPTDAVEAKCRMVTAHHAQLHRCGEDLQQAAQRAMELAEELGVPFLEDGASQAQLLGTATIGRELAEQGRVDCVVVPLACGALAGGLAWALKQGTDRPFVIGVQSVHFSRIAALMRGAPYELASGSTIADGLADDRVVEPAFSFCRRYVDDVVTVDDQQLIDAMRELWESCGIEVEGAAAAPLAGLRACAARIPGERVVLVISGANVDAWLRERVIGTTTRPASA